MRVALTPDVLARFWPKVNKDGPIVSEALGPCWDWIKATTKAGYGQIVVKIEGRFVRLYAHRVSFVLHKDTPLGNLEACHECNRPCCINPDHLYAGTHATNMRDAGRDGLMYNTSGPRGETDHFARLSDKRVQSLRAARSWGAPVAALAAEYGIDPTTVSNICVGKTRKAAGGPFTRSFTRKGTVAR